MKDNLSPTGAFVVDASLRSRASSVVSATDDTNAIETNMATVAEGIAVAHWTTDSIDASRIRQTSLVTIFCGRSK